MDWMRNLDGNQINIFVKKKKKTFFQKNKHLLYIEQILFLLEKREGVYFKLKYLLPYLQFFFLLYAKTFLVNRYEQ